MNRFIFSIFLIFNLSFSLPLLAAEGEMVCTVKDAVGLGVKDGKAVKLKQSSVGEKWSLTYRFNKMFSSISYSLNNSNGGIIAIGIYDDEAIKKSEQRQIHYDDGSAAFFLNEKRWISKSFMSTLILDRYYMSDWNGTFVTHFGIDGRPSIEGANNNTAEIFILDCRHNKDGIGDLIDAYFSELNR